MATTTDTENPSPDQIDRLLTLEEVRRIIGLSSATLYRLIARGQFPSPIRIGRTSRWPESEVSSFVQARMGSRETPLPTHEEG